MKTKPKELSYAMQDFLIRAARQPEGLVTCYGWGCGFFNLNTAYALHTRGLLDFIEYKGGNKGTVYRLSATGIAEAEAIAARRSAPQEGGR